MGKVEDVRRDDKLVVNMGRLLSKEITKLHDGENRSFITLQHFNMAYVTP